jgi:hypothetical protein
MTEQFTRMSRASNGKMRHRDVGDPARDEIIVNRKSWMEYAKKWLAFGAGVMSTSRP